jgi:hypothetical protein
MKQVIGEFIDSKLAGGLGALGEISFMPRNFDPAEPGRLFVVIPLEEIEQQGFTNLIKRSLLLSHHTPTSIF